MKYQEQLDFLLETDIPKISHYPIEQVNAVKRMLNCLFAAGHYVNAVLPAREWDDIESEQYIALWFGITDKYEISIELPYDPDGLSTDFRIRKSEIKHIENPKEAIDYLKTLSE